MTIAFDIHDNAISGLEWRMWLVPDSFVCASRKIFSTREEVIEEVKKIATTMKSDVVIYAGEELEQPAVHSLFTKKEPSMRKDIHG